MAASTTRSNLSSRATIHVLVISSHRMDQHHLNARMRSSPTSSPDKSIADHRRCIADGRHRGHPYLLRSMDPTITPKKHEDANIRHWGSRLREGGLRVHKTAADAADAQQP
jgi:hypothetical protein